MNVQSVRSSILIIGSANSNLTLGADSASDSIETIKLITEARHSVYVLHLPIHLESEYNKVFRNLRRQNHSFEIIICGDRVSQKLIEGLRISKFLVSENTSANNISHYEESIQRALERVQNTQQNQQLLELIHEQNKRLLNLGKTLEDRILKRQAYLQKTHLAITETNHRGEAFQRALIAVHRSNSIGEMERLLTEAIAGAFKMSWIRISLGQNRHVLEQLKKDRISVPVHTAELKLQNEVLGSVSFSRKTQAFSRSEKDFLTQISDSISLAIGRLKILRETEEIKHQWEATFNSITSPLAVINSRYEVLRANGAFLKHTEQKVHCYKLLMNRTSPCENCHLGERFRIDLTGDLGKIAILDVSSQKIPKQKNSDPDVFVNIYRDVSAQLQIESRIMESAKVAEMGTIGSSIAHELNNPLSGIITFIQLIKMDMKNSDKYYSDILALEAAAEKCKEIIQNLLSFSRMPDKDSQEELDLNMVVRRSIQIVELQSRSSEVVVESELEKKDLRVISSFGMLSQAFMTYLQLAIESARGLKIRPITLKIKTQIIDNQMHVLLVSPKVSASLQGPELLRRTIAERILADLGATVEYLAEMEDQLTVKIAFIVQKFPSEV